MHPRPVPRPPFHRLHLVRLEERLPPGDTVGSLLAWSVLGPGSSFLVPVATASAAPPRTALPPGNAQVLARLETVSSPVGDDFPSSWAPAGVSPFDTELSAEDWNSIAWSLGAAHAAARGVRMPAEGTASGLQPATLDAGGRPAAQPASTDLALSAVQPSVVSAPGVADDALLASVAALSAQAPGDGGTTTAGPSGSYTVTLLGQLHEHPGYAGVWGYVDPKGGEYALLGTRNGTSVVNVTDPTQPVQVAFIPGPTSGWREIQTYGSYAYVTTEGGGGVQIIDLSNLPFDATLAGTYRATVSNAHTLFIDTDSGYAYINGATGAPSQSRGGMNILDLNQDPTQPVEVGRYTTRYTHDSFVRNFGDVTVAFTSELSAGFSIVDVTNPADPQVWLNHRYPGNFTHNGWLAQDSRYFLTTDETEGGHLKVWDWWDFGNIVQVGGYSAHPNATIHNIYAGGDFAVAAYYAEGLRVIDMTDPTLPVEAGYFDTHPEWVTGFRGAWGAYPYLPSGNILLMDISTGLWIFSFDGTYAGRLRGTVRNASTGQPVPGATLRLSGVNTPQTTNASGVYGIGHIPDAYTLTVSRAGFKTYTQEVTLLSGKTLNLDVDLQPQ